MRLKFFFNLLTAQEKRILKELLYFEGDYPEFLAKRLNIPLSEIKNCLNILLTFGLVERDPKAQDYFVVREEHRSQLKNLLEKDGL